MLKNLPGPSCGVFDKREAAGDGNVDMGYGSMDGSGTSDECLATNLDATNNSAIIPVSIEVEAVVDKYLLLNHLLLVSCHGSSWPCLQIT